ncbi:hypothetical protein [Comamonas odontotermitis]|uniref:hypothetical protein n=1 Tax=Comamonas odontotermitis TaxID=379895 RepID=UPI00375168DA
MKAITLAADLACVIAPKQPTATASLYWKRSRQNERFMDGIFSSMALATRLECWEHSDGFHVISSVEHPEPAPGEMDLGPEYHITITHEHGRCRSSDALWVLSEFGVADAKEDNHVPNGFVRNFWRPVADHLSGYECPCQDSEPAMREDKGDFVWRGTPR